MPEHAKKAFTIAYLAPEIPALSATFVYNEILELNRLGVTVKPYSVHRPANIASEQSLAYLKKDVFHLYETPKWTAFLNSLSMLSLNPLGYLKASGRLFGDMLKLGILSRSAFAMCYRFFYSATLAKHLKKSKVQHLHVHFAHVPTDIAMYAAPMANIGFSVQAHANDLFERGWLLKEKVARSVFFATISVFNRNYLENLDADPDKIKIIRCGVDKNWQPPQKTSLINPIFTIGTVGRLVEKKGIDTLINATSLLINDGHQISLKIAGNGPLEEMLKLQLTNLELPENTVKFVGALPHDEVAAFINELDLFVLPCKKDSHGDMDGIPVVLMEAMLCEVPVISTEISGIPELVINNISGLTVTPGSADELSKAIMQIMHSPDKTKLLVSGAKQRVNNEFMLDKNVSKLISFIEETVK